MKLIPTTITFLTVLLVAIPAAFSADQVSQQEVDKRAFLRAQRAATAPTWTAALAVLQAIDVAKVDDVDVITYVDFSTRCAALAEDLGVSRDSDPANAGATLAEMDLAKFFATMWAVIERKGLTGAAKIAVEARRIQKQVPMYLELDAKLTSKYQTR